MSGGSHPHEQCDGSSTGRASSPCCVSCFPPRRQVAASRTKPSRRCGESVPARWSAHRVAERSRREGAVRVLRLPRVAELGDRAGLAVRDEDRVEPEALGARGRRRDRAARARRCRGAPRRRARARRARRRSARAGRRAVDARRATFSTCRPSAQRAVCTPALRRAPRARSPSRRRASSGRPAPVQPPEAAP